MPIATKLFREEEDDSYVRIIELLLEKYIEEKHKFDEYFKVKLKSFSDTHKHKKILELLKKIKST